MYTPSPCPTCTQTVAVPDWCQSRINTEECVFEKPVEEKSRLVSYCHCQSEKCLSYSNSTSNTFICRHGGHIRGHSCQSIQTEIQMVIEKGFYTLPCGHIFLIKIFEALLLFLTRFINEKRNKSKKATEKTTTGGKILSTLLNMHS